MHLLFKSLALIGLLLAAMPTQAGIDPDQPTALITGANRGLGLAFVEQFASRGWNIIATARDPEQAGDLQSLASQHEMIAVERLDLLEDEQIGSLAEKYREQPIDVLLNNAGLTPRYRSAFKPLAGIDFDIALRSFQINALGTLKVTSAFMENVATSRQKKIVVMSSKIGSFGAGLRIPMMYSYRGSKAALHMYMHTLAIETAKRDVILVMLSPGQVNTTPGMQIPGAIEVEESLPKMMTVIDALTPEHNGKFLDYEDGAVLPW